MNHKVYIFILVGFAAIGCNQPRSPSQNCRLGNAIKRAGQGFDHRDHGAENAIDDLRCDEMEREEHREELAREERTIREQENARLIQSMTQANHQSSTAHPKIDIITGAGSVFTNKLFVFGGQNYREFLGCLTCGRSALDSITNPHSQYGAGNQPNSMFNQYGPYGSVDSGYSPCNSRAFKPPIIVDSNGNYRGVFSIISSNQEIVEIAYMVCLR